MRACQLQSPQLLRPMCVVDISCVGGKHAHAVRQALTDVGGELEREDHRSSSLLIVEAFVPLGQADALMHALFRHTAATCRLSSRTPAS